MIKPMTVTLFGATVHAPVFRLMDRRTTRPRTKEWMLTRSVETILYGPAEV